MKLYGALGSHDVARVVLFARLKGIDLQPVLPQGGIKSPAFLARNPIGKMPVPEVDGVCTPESAVICTLLPAFTIFRKTFVRLLGVPDPTRAEGKLASWWEAIPEHPVAGPFLHEYEQAVDALLASLRQR